MPGNKPGPVCTNELGPHWIDSGTAVLTRSYAPIAVGSTVSELMPWISPIGMAGIPDHSRSPGGALEFASARTEATENRLAKKWFELADSIPFAIAPDQGNYFLRRRRRGWSQGLGAWDNPRATVINDTLVKYGFTQKNMEKDFGNAHSAVTYRLWERVSMRYAQALRGRVTAYVQGIRISTGAVVPHVKSDQRAIEAHEGRGAGSEVEKGYRSTTSTTRLPC